jgi:hypothetical protein
VMEIAATALVLALLAYVLPQIVATRRVSQARGGEAGVADHPVGEPADELARVRTIEERLIRCDVCGRPFVLSFERTPHPTKRGQSTVCQVWVRCGQPKCHRRQPVLVPMNSWDHSTREWLGIGEPHAHENLRGIWDAIDERAAAQQRDEADKA